MNSEYVRKSKRKIKEMIKHYDEASTFYVERLEMDKFGKIYRKAGYCLDRNEVLQFISKERKFAVQNHGMKIFHFS